MFVIGVTSLWADPVILRDGASYSGQFTGATAGQIGFTDGQGVDYKFPVGDVQSLVFLRTQDIVTLRNGKVYSGQYSESGSILFRDGQGIDYNFPLRAGSDVGAEAQGVINPPRHRHLMRSSPSAVPHLTVLRWRATKPLSIFTFLFWS
jgi:hypothetical protein